MATSAATDLGHQAHAGAAWAPFLPLVVFPRERRGLLEAFGPQLQYAIQRYLPRTGAIVFRGFPVSEDHHFQRFLALCSHDEASAPSRAARVWAWCALPGRGQRLLLADRRELYRAVPTGVRRRWSEWGLTYVQRDERGRALDSRDVDPVVLHPHSHEPLWAAPEHPALAGSFGGLDGLAGAGNGVDDCAPGGCTHWTVSHGGGARLAERDVRQVNAAVRACRSELCLEARDVVLLDPSLTAYAAAPGAGAGVVVRLERG